MKMLPPEYQKLRRLFSRQEKFKLIILFVLMMIAAVLEVAGIGMVPAFVAIVADPQRVLEHERFGPLFVRMGITGSRELLIYGAIALVGIFVIKNIYILFFHYVKTRFVYARRYLFSLRLMTAYMQAPYTFYLQRNSSELLCCFCRLRRSG
jgi:ATP-binding cassette, subfamily B, bacterial PglK